MTTPDERDIYGGWKGRGTDGTGFFRLEKTDRWRFVSPEGNAFFAFGVNHVQPTFLTREYCAAHWAKEFGLPADAQREQFVPGFCGKVRHDFDAFGLNNLGCHSSTHLYPASWVPYVHSIKFVEIAHWQEPSDDAFLDVFSPAFEAHCDRRAQEQAAPRATDPFLLGYSMTDCPIFTELDAASRGPVVYGNMRPGLCTWPRRLRDLGPGSPGKRAYVEAMQARYADIAAFNGTYGTTFRSWDGLANAVYWRYGADPNNERESADNAAFLLRVVERYYATAIAAIRRHDPNHLVFGDKLNGNTGVPDELIRVIAPHVDLLFYQFYGLYSDQKPTLDRWSELTGKALYNGDSSYSVSSMMMPRTLGPHCRDQQERAARFEEFAHSAFSRPDFVGWDWCGWVDSWVTHQKGRQHSGIQDPFGNYYEPLRIAMRTFASCVHEIADGRREVSEGTLGAWA